MDFDSKLSCDGFPSDTTTSSKTGVAYPCADHAEKKAEKPAELQAEPSCSQVVLSSSSSSTTISTGYFNSECRLAPTQRQDPPNIGYETAIAKSILQQYSTLSGDNLFDHLSDIIKRVIDERPPNVIDFFEEFSRNVREQKFHLPERFPPDAIYEESRMYRVAKKLLLSMKLPMPPEPHDVGAEEISEENKSALIEDMKLEISETQRLFITFSERIQHLQFYWNQCGFGINPDDIFQLACAMDRLQTHPSILQCRFWGIINGLKASYYVVEASLTREEITSRYDQMMEEMKIKHREMLLSILKRDEVKPLPSHIGPELTPGAFGWENYPPEELEKMLPAAAAIPLVEVVDVFNVPPEMVGLGVNRFSYFVVNAVSNDWIELPIVTPKQIIASRKIKKFLTGDLEAEVTSYPCFPGKEKHYLRAMISRITAGTYIAPYGYYRKMTKRERRLFEGLDDEEMEEEEEEEEPGEGEEEEGEVDNDIMLLKNEKYEPQPLTTITSPISWVHVRSNILNQGRVVWFDEEKARKEREKELARMLRMQLAEEMGEEEEEEEAEEEGEGEEEGLLEGFNPPEIGPPILNSCSFDQSDEYTIPWVSRFTSKFTNKCERILIMQSNVWPGAYTFTYENLCESIYMGWGHKYVSRNLAFEHLPSILEEYPHGEEDFIETIDPSVEEEEAYRLYLLRKQKRADDVGEENLSEFDDQEYESGSEPN